MFIKLLGSFLRTAKFTNSVLVIFLKKVGLEVIKHVYKFSNAVTIF